MLGYAKRACVSNNKKDAVRKVILIMGTHADNVSLPVEWRVCVCGDGGGAGAWGGGVGEGSRGLNLQYGIGVRLEFL